MKRGTRIRRDRRALGVYLRPMFGLKPVYFKPKRKIFKAGLHTPTKGRGRRGKARARKK